jgi:hypothetical protein
MSLRDNKLMVTTEQKERLLKAKVALSLHHELGRVPKEEEIEHMYRLARILRTAILGTHFLRTKQKQHNQVALF